jgi:hypothetical protein
MADVAVADEEDEVEDDVHGHRLRGILDVEDFVAVIFDVSLLFLLFHIIFLDKLSFKCCEDSSSPLI